MCTIENETVNKSEQSTAVNSSQQRVVIEDSVSEDQKLDFGVPQGSVLGPRIYCMYTKPVSDIISGMDCFTIPMQMTRSCI